MKGRGIKLDASCEVATNLTHKWNARAIIQIPVFHVPKHTFRHFAKQLIPRDPSFGEPLWRYSDYLNGHTDYLQNTPQGRGVLVVLCLLGCLVGLGWRCCQRTSWTSWVGQVTLAEYVFKLSLDCCFFQLLFFFLLFLQVVVRACGFPCLFVRVFGVACYVVFEF